MNNNRHRHRHVVLASPLLLPLMTATMTALLAVVVDCGSPLAFALTTTTTTTSSTRLIVRPSPPLPPPPPPPPSPGGDGYGRRSAATRAATSSGDDVGDYFPSTTMIRPPLHPPRTLATRTTARDDYDDDYDFVVDDDDDDYASRRLPPPPPPPLVRGDVQLRTLSRILLPSLLSSVVASATFPYLSLGLSYLINDAATFAVLAVDSSQFVQNFLTVTGLTFSILVGQTYYFMYQQQEAVFVSLFREVAEARSLLEQVALVCGGRRDMYVMCLLAMRRYVRANGAGSWTSLPPVARMYVEEDLKEGLGKDPARVLSARPVDDPLEVVMYITSVGVPSSIYDTVRSLRQARAFRLGALQKKLPPVHFLLLWVLAAIELSCFPVLGAGTQTIGGYNILTIEGCLFGIMTFGIVLTLNVVGELYAGSGGAYNVDSVLRLMISRED
ncbi:hypothetical protein ACHAW5_006416 [Stephanodiscus triporus]|uniref:Uncharacterized protein n=1 Tax=Stephanodiscus triporus TaxID=2934178 RepID=A0ABD3NN60_9STRA